ncbi:MAG: hypothetical protein AB7O98_11425 [Hyphomonadaceae bacterium]
MNDENLSAFLDRELSEERRAEAARGMADNPGAAARMFIFRRGDETLRQAISLPNSPNDHAVAQRILNAPPVLKSYPQWARPVAAMAAACVLGLLVGRETTSPLSFPRMASQVQGALDRLQAGETEQTGVGTVTVAMTVRQADGRLCRQFRAQSGQTTSEAVACRNGGAWTIVAIANAADEARAFHTAGAANSALSVVLNALGDAALVEESEERRLISGGWSEAVETQQDGSLPPE